MMLNSYGRGSPQQTRNLNDTRNNSTILNPEITSTPLNSPNKGKISSPLVTPTRKLLGPRRYALSNNGVLSPMKTIKDPPGPLLTSTNFNVNLSTYIDTKSPGYSGRLVQYNEESSRNQHHTHQEKYGSPGLFPIVHLFKKNVPVISPKPKVTVRIGTPELKNHYSQEHNRLLLEGIVRNNSVIKHHNHSGNEVSTRSVLDALKEISRKRIHASEDYEVIDETNKKLRVDCFNGDGDSSKRNRVDSPTSDNSVSPPTRQATKKLCTIDAILASKTSSMYANYDTGNKRKTIEDVKTKISPVNKKKFTNVETQTICTPTEEKKIIVESNVKQPDDDKKQEETSSEQVYIQNKESHPPKQILKVFDDKPLEIIRKNRLGALLSALTGHEIPPIPMEDRRKALDQEWPPQSSEKKITSILSPQNKQPKSVEKHVTFNLPENSDSQTSSSEGQSDNISLFAHKVSTEKDKSIPLVQNEIAGNLDLTSDLNKSTLQKLSDQEIISTKKSQISADMGKNLSNVSSSESFKFEGTKSTTSINNPSPIGGFKFDLAKPITSSPNNSVNKNNNSGSFQFTSKSESKVENPKINIAASSVQASSSSTTSPNLFSKFEASTSKLNNSSVLSSKNSFETNLYPKSSPVSSTNTNSLGLPVSLPQSSVAPSTAQPTSLAPFIFNTTQPTANSTANFFENKSSSDNNKTNKASSSFGNSFMLGPTGVSTSLTFGTTVSYSSANSTKVSVGISKTVSSSSSPYSSPTNINPILSVGTSAVSSTSNTVSPALSSSTTGLFGAISSSGSTPLTTNNFGNPTSKNLFSATSITSRAGASSSVTAPLAPSFGNVTTGSSGLNLSSGNSLPPYGNLSATPAFPVISSIVPASVSVSSPSFGTGSFNVTKATTASFASLPAATAPFGTIANNNPVFGSTSTPSIEDNALPNNSFSTITKPFAFGNSTTFGNQSAPVSSASMFTLGTVTNTSTAQNIQFGTGASSFAAAGNNIPPLSSGSTFGQSTAAPSFGSTSIPTFGAPQPASTFGTSGALNFGVSNTATPTFGKTSLPNFGVPVSTTSIFGTTNPPTFGATTTVSGFGTTNTSAFGVPSTATPAFGTNTPTFGGHTTSSGFGTSNTLTFGNPTTTGGFGTSNTPSFGSTGAFKTPSFGTSTTPFGAPATTSSNMFNSSTSLPFGSSTAPTSFGSFGSASSPFNPITTASSFGTNNNTFGSNTANNFGSSNATNNAFGSSNVTNNAFGSSNTSGTPFGGTPMSSAFGSTNTPGSSTFVSGFGATVPKPEQSSIFPPANNMFGNNSTFGSSQSNNLNAASTGGVFTFGSPNAQPSSSTGVFAFGTTEPPKAFNFSTPGSSGGTSTVSGTGFPAPPPFGQPSNVMPNMFNIGSGTSTTQNRSRPLARAKRRT